MSGPDSYARCMPTVFVLDRDRPVGMIKFHRKPSCRQLAKVSGRPEEKDVSLLGPTAIPCRTCYPDAPRPESAHRFCELCNTTRPAPCAHNGGVLVKMTRTRRGNRVGGRKGSTYVRRQYVWPEKAHLFTRY